MDQISIFDFPEWLPEEDFQTMTSKRAAEIVGDRLGVKFKLYERYFENYFKAKKDGFEITIGFSVGFDGNRFLDTEVDHGSSCYGNPAKSIDDCVDSIKSYIEKESKKADKEKPICKFSGHSCNKKELWNVAQSLDNVFCPHVCCRKCSDRQCGARCNGADVQISEQNQWNNLEQVKPEEGQFCLFEYLWTMHQKEDSKGQCTGWWKDGKVNWLNMPYDIGRKRVIRWKAAEEPKQEPVPVDIKGICDDGYCPECGGMQDDLAECCQYCGITLDWTRWKKIQGMEDED